MTPPVIWTVRTAAEVQEQDEQVQQFKQRMEPDLTTTHLQFVYWSRVHQVQEYSVGFCPVVHRVEERRQILKNLDAFLGKHRVFDGKDILWMPHALPFTCYRGRVTFAHTQEITVTIRHRRDVPPEEAKVVYEVLLRRTKELAKAKGWHSKHPLGVLPLAALRRQGYGINDVYRVTPLPMGLILSGHRGPDPYLAQVSLLLQEYEQQRAYHPLPLLQRRLRGLLQHAPIKIQHEQKNVYVIVDINFEQDMFTYHRQGMTLYGYYQRVYGIQLEHPRWPVFYCRPAFTKSFGSDGGELLAISPEVATFYVHAKKPDRAAASQNLQEFLRFWQRDPDCRQVWAAWGLHLLGTAPVSPALLSGRDSLSANPPSLMAEGVSCLGLPTLIANSELNPERPGPSVGALPLSAPSSPWTRLKHLMGPQQSRSPDAPPSLPAIVSEATALLSEESGVSCKGAPETATVTHYPSPGARDLLLSQGQELPIPPSHASVETVGTFTLPDQLLEEVINATEDELDLEILLPHPPDA